MIIKKNISTFFDTQMKRRLNKGVSWQNALRRNYRQTPSQVYVSFDIDGLSPDLCPGTGTPVLGVCSFDQALTLFATLADHKKRIIGFDLCEVASQKLPKIDWNGNVGARILLSCVDGQ